jgi:hypothetical protein
MCHLYWTVNAGQYVLQAHGAHTAVKVQVALSGYDEVHLAAQRRGQCIPQQLADRLQVR